MGIIKQYFKIIGYAFAGLAFGFASFFLFINIYHYLEVRREFGFNSTNDAAIISLDKKLSTIESNVSAFATGNYNGSLSVSEANKLKNYFTKCVDSFKNDTITDIRNKNSINIIDVYNLRDSYENSVASECLVGNFIWLSTAKEDNYESEFIRDNSHLYASIITNLVKDTDYVKKELLNNSSYFFNTDISTVSVKNTPRDAFYSIIGSYDKSADFILSLSEWYKDAVTTPTLGGE